MVNAHVRVTAREPPRVSRSQEESGPQGTRLNNSSRYKLAGIPAADLLDFNLAALCAGVHPHACNARIPVG